MENQVMIVDEKGERKAKRDDLDFIKQSVGHLLTSE